MQRIIAAFVVSFFVASVVWASETVSIQFFTHAQVKFVEQDVFTESVDTPGEVVRVESEEVNKTETLAKALYGTSGVTPRDPFQIGQTPLGPFAKGKPLGFTLGEWLAATGTGTYTVDEENVDLSLTFTKLIPSGVYTTWCSRLTLPPNVETLDRPCGAADGTQNSFIADTSGNGTIAIKLGSPLAESTKETVTVIALVYHSDGKTYGDKPGDFGRNSHVQLLWFMPAKEEAPAPSAATASNGRMPWELVVLAILMVGVSVRWMRRRPFQELGDDE